MPKVPSASVCMNLAYEHGMLVDQNLPATNYFGTLYYNAAIASGYPKIGAQVSLNF
jgi:hypothetical protein